MSGVEGIAEEVVTRLSGPFMTLSGRALDSRMKLGERWNNTR
jgi:hypothetical protein